MNIEGAEAPAFRGATEMLRITQHVAVSRHDLFVGEGGPAMRTKAEVRSSLEGAASTSPHGLMILGLGSTNFSMPTMRQPSRARQ